MQDWSFYSSNMKADKAQMTTLISVSCDELTMAGIECPALIKSVCLWTHVSSSAHLFIIPISPPPVHFKHR